MSKLAVVIMVKNESAIIERCLHSVASHADLVIITDTGSTDDTMYKAGMFLQNHNIKFKIYNEPFVDFGHNRTRLLELARAEKDIDYVLMIDADETLEGDFDKKHLWGDFYNIDIKVGATIYHLPRMTRNAVHYYYEGVTHEYLSSKGITGGGYPLQTCYIKQHNDSYRRKTNNKFKNDAELLVKALEKETNTNLRARYAFYLAQTYKDLGWIEVAEHRYNERLYNYEGWIEERFYCHYQVAIIETKKHKPSQQTILYNCLTAYELCPWRIESLVVLRDYWRSVGKVNSANMIDKTIKLTPCPKSGLFVEQDKYEKFS